MAVNVDLYQTAPLDFCLYCLPKLVCLNFNSKYGRINILSPEDHGPVVQS